MERRLASQCAAKQAAVHFTVEDRSPRPRARSGDLVRRDHWRAVAVALVVLGALGPWLLQLGSTAADSSGAEGVLAIPGGELRIDRIVELPNHGQMPGMVAIAPVPPDHHRIAVEATVIAPGSEPVRYDAQDFLISASGLDPRPPGRGQPGPATVAPGASVTVRFLFDVPDETTDLRLGHRQVAASVALEAAPTTHPEKNPDLDEH